MSSTARSIRGRGKNLVTSIGILLLSLTFCESVVYVSSWHNSFVLFALNITLYRGLYLRLKVCNIYLKITNGCYYRCHTITFNSNVLKTQFKLLYLYF